MIAQLTLWTALILGSLEDIRIREVPDLLSFSLLGIGLILGLERSLATTSFLPFTLSVVTAALAFSIGAALYYLGQWGGGDAKLLAGVASFFTPSTFLAYFFYVLVMGSVFGLLWTVWLVVKDYEVVSSKASLLKHKYVVLIVLLTGAVTTTTLFVLGKDEVAALVGLATFVVLSTGALYALKKAENTLLFDNKPVSTLVPGDWLAHSVSVDGTLIENKGQGLTEKEVSLLKTSEFETVRVKDGLPFVPSFLLAYGVYIALGSASLTEAIQALLSILA